jgi:hypothetical protein
LVIAFFSIYVIRVGCLCYIYNGIGASAEH